MYLPSNWTEVFEDPLVRSIPLWGFFFGGFVLLFNVPTNVLEELPVLEALVSVTGSVVPSISGWGRHSTFPQPTLLFFSYVWIFTPLLALVVFLHRPSEMRFLSVWKENPKKAPLRVLALLLLTGGFLGITASFSIVDTPTCSICINRSMIAQAIYGGLVGLSNAGLLATFGWWIKNFRELHLE